MDYSEMSNMELTLERQRLEDSYESTKAKINALYEQLESLEKEYSELNKEREKRRTL